MEDNNKKYSFKLINQPLIRLRGPSYSFSYSHSFKSGLYDNCRSSGIFYTRYSNPQHDLHDDPDQTIINHKKIDKVIIRDDLIRLPVPDVDSIYPLLTRLVQQLCRRTSDERAAPRRVWKIARNEEEEDNNKNNNKFCQACTLPIISPPYYYSDESCDFYLHKWCADLPNELKGHPIHPNHILNLFMSTPNDSSGFGVFVCNGCNFPVNGFGFKCTECSSDYSLCIRCASLPRCILHESHKHPLVLNRGSNEFNCDACCSDVRGSQLATFTCDECGFGIHGTCALLPRTIKHRYDEHHPFALLYPTLKSVKDEDGDLSSRPFCEICEKDVNYAKENDRGWLYHCEDCDMFGCVECFAMDMNLLSMIKPAGSELLKMIKLEGSEISNV